MELDRLVKVAVRQYVEERRKGLLSHDVSLAAHSHDRRTHVVGVGCLVLEQSLTPNDQAPPLLSCRLDRVAHRRKGGLMNKRSDERSRSQRVANDQSTVGGRQSLNECLNDALMHNRSAQRGAALPRSSRGAKHNPAHREVQVG